MTGTTTAVGALVSIREQLLRVLTQLDEAGERVAAAHLVAVIDTIEDRVGPQQIVRDDDAPERSFDVIARVLTARYGEQAETVARQQLAASSGDSIITWACVVERLESSKRGL